MKKTYRIPLAWTVLGTVDVEAETEEQAIELAMGPEVPLPPGEFLEDSLEVDGEVKIISEELPK